MTALHVARLRHAPAIRSVAAVPASGDIVVRVDGMVCSVCAARTASALRRVPGVEAAQVDLAGGTARLQLLPGASVDGEALQRALEGVVVGMRVRRWLQRATGGGRR